MAGGWLIRCYRGVRAQTGVQSHVLAKKATKRTRALYAALGLSLAAASLWLYWRQLRTQSAIDLRGSTANEDPEPVLFEPRLLKVPGLPGSHFRVQACTAEPQLPGSPRWRQLSAGDQQALNWLEVAEDFEEGRPRVACLVYSMRRNRQLLRDSYAVWGQDCDEWLPFSNEAWTDPAAGYTTVEVHPDVGPDNYDNIIAKMRKQLQDVGRRLEAGELSFDFLIVSGDDAFWILRNLRMYLRDLPRMGVGVYLGHRFAKNGDPLTVYASGAGYVINKVAFRAYLSCQEPRAMRRSFEEDAVMGLCLRAAGISVWPSEDAMGRRRFHFAGPSDMAGLNFSQPSDPSGQWVRTFHKPWLSTMLMGPESLSKSSVLFHAVMGQRRFDMHDWLYHRLACRATVPGAEGAAAA